MRATKAGHFHAAIADTVVLTLDERMRQKAVFRTVQGHELEINLAEPPLLGRGDGYLLEDGRMIEVLAAPEPLIEVRTPEAHLMSRIAFLLGTQQQDCEISPKYIRLRRDAKISIVLQSMGAKVLEIDAPFQPEGTAAQNACTHDHHDHGHSHHTHGHDHGNDHEHHAGCGHDHDHKH
jgi:urease accessory protein